MDRTVWCPNCGVGNLSWRSRCESCGAPLHVEVTNQGPTTPVNLTVEYPEHLSRVLLFFKWLLAIPLYIGLFFYAVSAGIVTFIAFWAILFIGRYPQVMFNHVRGYLEWQFKIYAYFPLLMSDSWFPEEVDYEVDYPERSSRLALVFLKLPSFLLDIVPGLYGLVLAFLFIVAIPVWCVILLLGKYPRRLFEFNVGLLQWVARVMTWQWLLRDDWSLFGTKRPVQIAVVIGLATMLVLSISSYTPVLPSITPLGLWFGGIGYGGQGEAVVTEFMEAGRAPDIEAATRLQVDPVAMRTDVENFILQNRYLFNGFDSAQCTGWAYNKELGESAVLQLQGELNYQSGPKGTFQCTLVKMVDKWKIYSIWINRPPE